MRNSTNDDERVICILQNWAWEIVYKGVKELPFPRGVEKELLEDIHNNVEKERRERISLSQPTATLNPTHRNAVKKNGSLTGKVESFDSNRPNIRKAFGLKIPVERIPADGVKGFAEVKFENRHGSVSFMVGSNNISGIDKNFGYRSASDETSLVRVDKGRKERLEAEDEAFGDGFEAELL